MTYQPLPFEIPLYFGEMLEDATHQAFNSFVNAGHKTPAGNTIIGLYVHAMVDSRDPEHNEPGHFIGLYAETPEGEVITETARKLQGPVRTAFNAVAGAWAVDDIIQQSIMGHPIKWRDNECNAHDPAGKLLTYHHLFGMAALTQEYIPTFLQGDSTDPLGPDVAMDFRTNLGSLILPPAKSNHEKIKQLSTAEKAYDQFEKIWSILCEHIDVELVKPDFSQAVEIK